MGNLLSAVDELAAADPAGLPAAALQDELGELHTALARLSAEFTRRVAALDAVGACDDALAVPAGAWLRHALRIAPTDAATTVALARRCFGAAADPGLGGLGALGAAWAEGRIERAHVREAEKATRRLPAPIVTAMTPILLDVAAAADPPAVRAIAARAREAADPDGAARAAHLQHQGRDLSVAVTFAGMVSIGGILDPTGGATLLAALDPLARKDGADDQRNRGQRYADALVELADQACRHGQLPTTGGEPAQVALLVDLPTLTGTGTPTAPTEATRSDRINRDRIRGGDGCDAYGHWLTGLLDRNAPHGSRPGPLPPLGLGGVLTQTGAHVGTHTARRICCDAAVHRVLRAHGEILDLGRKVRLVSDAQRRALVLRDAGCRFPGCHARAAHTVAHHVKFWADGGPTDLNNLVLLCLRHHLAVHEGGWTLQLAPDATVTVHKGTHTLRAPPPQPIPEPP